MKYKITDLAELIGCSTSAIRYFEKEKLIAVQKDDSGHRLYDIIDVFRLLSYEKYRSMEIPMRTIVEQFSGGENDRHLIQKREEICKEEALEKAKFYTNLANSIEEHLSSIRNIDTLLNHYELAQSPSRVIICDNECGWLSKNRHSQQLLQKWIKSMPQVQLAVLHESLAMSDFGYMVSPDVKKDLNLPTGLQMKTLPGTSCLHTIAVVDETFMMQPQKIFDNALTYGKNKHLDIGQGAWGKFLLVEVGEQSHLKIYVELWIPIKV